MRRIILAIAIVSLSRPATAEGPLRVGTFDVDASPPIGSPMAYDPTDGVQDPLHCRGIVLLGDEAPVAIVAVDWIGIGGGGQDAFKTAIAEAVGTTTDRVAVHTLHQHDAPTCDFSVAELLEEHGIDPSSTYFDTDWARGVIARAAEAAAEAKGGARAVSEVGTGEALVDRVASNRRILGPDGKVRATRFTACKDPELRSEPAGTIDPFLKLIAFYDGDEAVAALTYYACHPQSYYRTGLANPDFPGLAREDRIEETGVPHVHFDGAGGNIGAGKWNDGAPENREALAGRVAIAMAEALEAAGSNRAAVSGADLSWQVLPVALPTAPHLVDESLASTLADGDAPVLDRITAARDLDWLRRRKAGGTIPVSCLGIGPARVLHLPGELFVEYQLAAQAIRPDLFVAVAAYGDYAPGYIGTAAAYFQGGYEASPRASNVGPGSEVVLLGVIGELLKD